MTTLQIIMIVLAGLLILFILLVVAIMFLFSSINPCLPDIFTCDDENSESYLSDTEEPQ